jgi:hypothetical protein
MRWLAEDYCLILDHFEKNYDETRTSPPALHQTPPRRNLFSRQGAKNAKEILLISL